MAPEEREVRPAGGGGSVTAVPFVGMISAFEDLFDRAASRLSDEFGPVAFRCDVFPFDFTDYYNAEMGDGLLRTYFIFGGSVKEDDLRQMKSVTSTCEGEFLCPETKRRRINLDPGILTTEHLVLASHKKVAHRICLGDGVYAELELIYINGAYQPLPWTYPDYRTEAALTFLEEARAALSRGARPTVREP